MCCCGTYFGVYLAHAAALRLRPCVWPSPGDFGIYHWALCSKEMGSEIRIPIRNWDFSIKELSIANGQQEIFTTLEEARGLIEQWRKEYNQVRPHSAKNYRPPAPEKGAGPLAVATT